jgi:TolB-like protein/Tfp pilus assembly protein PilF
LVAFALASISLASLLGWRIRSSAADANYPAKIRSLAVLPLENLSGDASQDYFVDGMTDALITQLGQASSLRVISRTSVMQYRGVHKPLPQIARELNVDAVVEGAVARSGEQVRITAQLIHAADDKHLWAQSYQGDLRDVLQLQNQIATAIAQQVRTRLAEREPIGREHERSINPKAYESYLKGEYSLNGFTPESVGKAADYFQQAIEQDPNYVPAYSKLAGSYQILGNMGVIPKRETYPKDRILLARALELDPQSASTHAVLGWGLLEYDLEFAAAGTEFKRAVELNPNGVEGHEGLGNYYATVGHVQQAVQEMKRAREVDPLGQIVNSDLCRMLYFARLYDEAVAQCKANSVLDPNSARGIWQLGAVYAATGMDSEATLTFLQSLEHTATPPAVIAAVKRGANKSGLKGYWRTLAPILEENVKRGYLEPCDVAVAYAYAGNADAAMTWLDRALEARCFGINYVGVDPTFDQLHSDSRFRVLLSKIGLQAGQANVTY